MALYSYGTHRGVDAAGGQWHCTAERATVLHQQQRGVAGTAHLGVDGNGALCDVVRLRGRHLCSYGVYSYGVYSHGLYSYGLRSVGRLLNAWAGCTRTVAWQGAPPCVRACMRACVHACVCARSHISVRRCVGPYSDDMVMAVG